MKCKRCDGTGQEQDWQKVGHAHRIDRINNGWGMREIARRMGMSSGYISLLETGGRRWTREITAKYNQAIKRRNSSANRQVTSEIPMSGQTKTL